MQEMKRSGFYYKENLEILESMGCELICFSPLRDKQLPDGIEGMIFGGGYPELYAQQLSENRSMLMSVRAALEKQIPCLAECGGFMYLQERLEGSDGKMYDMAGALFGKSYKTEKLRRFGYIILSKGTVLVIMLETLQHMNFIIMNQKNVVMHLQRKNRCPRGDGNV